MTSMSYVLFENTTIDLKACLDAIQEGKKLSKSEEANKHYLIQLCIKILEEEGYDITKYGEEV